MGLRTFFLFCLLICSLTATRLYSQDRVQLKNWQDSFRLAKDDTSRVNALRKLGGLYRGINTDSALFFSWPALALAEKIQWTKGIAQNSLNIGSYWQYISNYDSAIFYDNKALVAAQQVGEKSRVALIYINRGSAYTETQQYDKAIADITKAIQISEEAGDKDRQARAAQSMCEIYMYQRNNPAAKPWAEKALRLNVETGNEEMQSVAEMSLGGLYSIERNFQKAETILQQSIRKARKTNRPDVILESCLSLSDVYVKTFRYTKAIEVIREGLVHATSLNAADRASALYYGLGLAFTGMHNNQSAFDAFKQGYELIKGKQAFETNQYDNLYGMAKAAAALNDYKNAYQYSTLAGGIKDSSLEKERNNNLLTLQARFETQTREKEIALLKKDQQLHTVELQKERAIKIGAFILAGLLVVIGLLAVNRYRTIQNTRRIMEIEKLRYHIARDLHDDIGSALSSININSNMALHHSGEEAVVKSQLERIKKNSGSMMESMGDIVWAINPINDSIENLLIKMQEFLAEILEPLNIHYRFSDVAGLKKIKLDVAKRKEIYLIFKEAVNNAAKYSQCTAVVTELSGNAKELVVRIQDDGLGFEPAFIKQGNGLGNMQHRAMAIGGHLDIHTAPGKGTQVVLSLPIT